jgi:hypothetical protein
VNDIIITGSDLEAISTIQTCCILHSTWKTLASSPISWA